MTSINYKDRARLASALSTLKKGAAYVNGAVWNTALAVVRQHLGPDAAHALALGKHHEGSLKKAASAARSAAHVGGVGVVLIGSLKKAAESGNTWAAAQLARLGRLATARAAVAEKAVAAAQAFRRGLWAIDWAMVDLGNEVNHALSIKGILRSSTVRAFVAAVNELLG